VKEAARTQSVLAGKIKPYDVWVFAVITSGQTLNGELDKMSNPSLRRMAVHLNDLKQVARPAAWQAMMAARPDADQLIQAVADQDPAQAPTEEPPIVLATAADILRLASSTQWTWKGWIEDSALSGLAAFEGIGKTRLFMDLNRRIYHAMPWPDGQPPSFSQGTVCMWICADGHQREIAEMAAPFGIPLDAIVFPSLDRNQPYDGTRLDDLELVREGGILETAITIAKPGLVFIDTLTYATQRDLCSQDQVAALKAPLVRICQGLKTSMVFGLHLSKEGQALGRRTKGITRVLSHLECPDPANYKRLRLWVEKSHAEKPQPLGVTMEDDGNRYDSSPPGKLDLKTVGRPGDKREKAMQFIRDALAVTNDQTANELAVRCDTEHAISEKTFWRAVEDLRENGEIVTDGGKGTGRQTTLHRILKGTADDPPI
jgi:hypothetical protein